MGVSRNVFHTRPPHLSSGSDKQKSRSQAVSAASATAVAFGLASGTDSVEYVSIVSSTACHICTGLSTLGAATTADYLLPANTPVRWELNPREETHFSVIRDTADGTLYWYLPGN